MKRKDNVFSQVFNPKIDSNDFDLSCEKKFTFNMGELVPVKAIEVLPGDVFNMSYVNMLRFLPLIAPVMHKIKVKTEIFFVPNRILWPGWEDFITGVSTDAHPIIRIGQEDFENVTEGSNADYIGIPPGAYGNCPYDLNAFPIAALSKIWDDWYRADTIIPEQFVPLVAGDNNAAYFSRFADPDSLYKRAWRHDQLTSALLTTQQGTEVSLPLTFQDNIPVEFMPVSSGAPGGTFVNPTNGTILPDGAVEQSPGPGPFSHSLHVDGNTASYNPLGTLVVDVQSEAASINDLREAWTLQSFLERCLRGGVRYVEQLMSLFGVRSSDARLQRPELIGSSTDFMTISEVLSTSQSSPMVEDAEVILGEMGGHGISFGGNHGINYRAEEHGHIIILLSVIPDSGYQDGISKHMFKSDRFDYAFPDFANLGEQPVLLREVQALLSDDIGSDTVFGYMPQYSEYRYEPDTVAGNFRSNLAYWTLNRRFTNQSAPPSLTEDFINCSPRHDIFAVTDPSVDKVLADVVLKCHVSRKLPRYGVPATI